MLVLPTYQYHIVGVPVSSVRARHCCSLCLLICLKLSVRQGVAEILLWPENAVDPAIVLGQQIWLLRAGQAACLSLLSTQGLLRGVFLSVVDFAYGYQKEAQEEANKSEENCRQESDADDEDD